MNLHFGPREKTLRMIWRIEKNGRPAHLIGTAHFFPHSFAGALTRLIRNASSVLFEGPLDEASSQRIAEYGRQGASAPALADAVTPEAHREIDRLLRQRLANDNTRDLYALFLPKPDYFEQYTRGVRPWAAFFSIWTTYLGWKYSMDLEGYQIARQLNKPVGFLETLEEQLAVLDGIPLERIARQLNDVANWRAYQDAYVATFLAGDLAKMMTLTQRFVTRGPVVVGARDQILFDRMKPIFDQQDTVAFIGFPHIPGVTQLLDAAGYRVTQVCV